MWKAFVLFIPLFLLFAQPGEVTDNILKIGDSAPHFQGTDQHGEQIDSEKITAEKPLVLIFYRGVWCPHCIKHLTRLQDSLSMLQDAGVRVVLVANEQPKFIGQTIEKTGAQFSIISDSDYSIMENYKVAFKIDHETVPNYYDYVLENTRRVSGTEEDILPVPATFIINTDNKIHWMHFDTDYTIRAKVAEILRHLP